jgi:Uma2 family endonuclease
VSRTVIQIGPADNGRPMSLVDFDHAEGQAGYRYELSRGVVTVVDVPDFRHAAQLDSVGQQLAAYRLNHPRRVCAVLGGGDCKILLSDLESERHPDLSVYRSPPKQPRDWATWVPDIVIEIVSPSSRHRDYNEKPEEYRRFGVREYWVIDEERQEMLAHRQAGVRWVLRTIRPPQKYTTRLLPGFELDLEAVFDAARGMDG